VSSEYCEYSADINFSFVIGAVSTYAGNGSDGYLDGSALRAQFNSLKEMAIDTDEALYVTDNSRTIRKIANGAFSLFLFFCVHLFIFFVSINPF